MKDFFKKEITNTMSDLALSHATSTLKNINMAHSMRTKRLFSLAKHPETNFPSVLSVFTSLKNKDE